MSFGSVPVPGRLAMRSAAVALAAVLGMGFGLMPGTVMAASVIPSESTCVPTCGAPAIDGAEDIARAPAISGELSVEANPLRKYAPIQQFLKVFGAGAPSPAPALPAVVAD